MTALVKNRAAVLWAAAILLCIGFGTWQIGQAAYIMAKAELAQVLLERAWSKTLQDGKPHKAWAWADMWPVAKIEFPARGESRIVLSNTSGEALAFGPGHLLGSALPGGKGTSVIAGHRDTHFSLLRELENDETVTVTTGDGTRREYIIRETRIVFSDNSHIDPRIAGRLVLVTCYPFDARDRGPLRYAVFANEKPDAS